MKILLFALLSFSAMAQEFPVKDKELPPRAVAQRLLSNLADAKSQALGECDKSFTGDDLAKCQGDVEDYSKGLRRNALAKYFAQADIDARETVRAEVSEAKCVKFLRRELDSMEVLYDAGDDCEMLKAKRDAALGGI